MNKTICAILIAIICGLTGCEEQENPVQLLAINQIDYTALDALNNSEIARAQMKVFLLNQMNVAEMDKFDVSEMALAHLKAGKVSVISSKKTGKLFAAILLDETDLGESENEA